MLFSSITMLAPCVALGTAAVLYQNDRRVLESSSPSLASTEMGKLGITELIDFDGARVLQNLVSCAIGGCQDSSVGNCSQSTLALGKTLPDQEYGFSPPARAHVSLGTRKLTETHHGKVIISYLIHSLLCITFFGFAKLMVFWIPAGFAVLLGHPWTSFSDQRRHLALSRPYAALFSTLVEFQEMQGLLVIAIQLATLATFSSSGECPYALYCPTIDSVSSLGEALLNAKLVRGPAINGALPVLLAQITLQRAGLRWSYPLVFTTLASALAAIIQWRADGEAGGGSLPSFASLVKSLRAVEAIKPCGGNPSLRAYCVVSLLDDDSYQVDGLLLACLVLPWLTADMVLGSEAGRHWWRTSGNGRMRQLSDKLERRIGSRVGLSSSQWTYGQLIAATVWAPILAKFVYYNIFGVEHGFTKRLVRPYEVIRRKGVTTCDFETSMESSAQLRGSSKSHETTQTVVGLDSSHNEMFVADRSA
ncbi:hypothetical protein BR93DRAFT_961828 [Coniochaeta sp. PMI_546]|nr:hypothetical protein BR93DRAFT_961828 [Coniochaeta sp. PMI_546]